MTNYQFSAICKDVFFLFCYIISFCTCMQFVKCIALNVAEVQYNFLYNAYNNVRDILYNTDAITNIVKSIVHSPVGKLV